MTKVGVTKVNVTKLVTNVIVLKNQSYNSLKLRHLGIFDNMRSEKQHYTDGCITYAQYRYYYCAVSQQNPIIGELEN
jgi:hypothetical protein